MSQRHMNLWFPTSQIVSLLHIAPIIDHTVQWHKRTQTVLKVLELRSPNSASLN